MLMAAASVDLPAIMVTGGPMLSGNAIDTERLQDETASHPAFG
jgi:dihydroxyacid dehydratase/phosphogluconate dehydratase